jgi:hypothetical protein
LHLYLTIKMYPFIANVDGSFNLAGHTFRFMSFCFLYIGISYSAMKFPFELLFFKLTKTNRELERLRELQCEFEEFMVHDIRVACTAIRGYVESECSYI